MSYTPIGRESGNYYQDPKYPTVSQLVRPTDNKRPSDNRYPQDNYYRPSTTIYDPVAPPNGRRPDDNRYPQDNYRPPTTIYDPIVPPNDRRPNDNRYPSNGYRPSTTIYEPDRHNGSQIGGHYREPDIYRPGNNHDYYPRPPTGNVPPRKMEVDVEVDVGPGGRTSHKISYCNSCNPRGPQGRSTIFIDDARNVDFVLRSDDNKPQLSTDGRVRQQPALENHGGYHKQVLY